MGGNRDPTLASSMAETDGRRSKRAVSPVDHVRDEPEHRHQKDEGEPKDTINPRNPGVLVHSWRDEEECDVEREEERPERNRRARRGRLKRDRDVCQDDGHLDHSTARSRSRGIPSSNIYIIMHEFAKPTGGEAAGRADHGRIAARPGNGLVHHRDSFLPVSLCGYPFARRGGDPDHRGRRPGDKGAARNVSWLSARIRVPSVHSASSGPTRSTGCRCSRSASRRGAGSVLHELRFADRDRDLVLPELRRPRRTLTRSAMPLWRADFFPPPVAPGRDAPGRACYKRTP